MRVSGVVLVVALGLLLAGCHGGGAQPLAPRAYLDHALSLMQREAVVAPRVDWTAVDRKARGMAEGALSTRQTYPAILYAVSQLRRAGDGHATFFDPTVVKSGGKQTLLSRLHPLPSGAANGRIGEVSLPNFEVPFSSIVAKRYLTTALSAIAKVQTTRHPCGWIVNLDGDFGGNGWAMVLSVGPIIGDGRVFGFLGRKGLFDWASYKEGVIRGTGLSLRAPVRVPAIAPAPPVAVLTSPETASGGELAAVAFRGRPDTRSFGSQTYGATTGPRVFSLPDGAELFFGVDYFVDRRGRVYRHAIEPDVSAYPDRPAATRWLLHTPACTKPGK